ncbi:MAG: DUF3786 domain-containing protein [Deltaproteobacteria bacterium]
MSTIYEKTLRQNLRELYDHLPENLEENLPALRKGDTFTFTAFGEACAIEPDRITFSGEPDYGPRGILVSLYASHVNPEPLKLEPLKAFKDLPGSMPYQGAFRARSEQVLVPWVGFIQESLDAILGHFQGEVNLADEDFPASVTCLFSANAVSFMPLDGLADVAEYSSEKILAIVKKRR